MSVPGRDRSRLAAVANGDLSELDALIAEYGKKRIHTVIDTPLRQMRVWRFKTYNDVYDSGIWSNQMINRLHSQASRLPQGVFIPRPTRYLL